MSKGSRLIGTTLILLVGTVGTKLINFIMLPFLTAWLSVEEYGSVDIFLTVISMVVPLVTLQLDQAVFRFLIDDQCIDEKRRTVSSGVVCLGFLLLVLTLGVGVWCLLWGEPIYLLYAAAIDLNAIYVMAQQIVRGEGKSRAYTVSSILYAFLVMGLAALFIRGFGLGFHGYIYGYLTATAVCILHLFLAGKCGHLIRVCALGRDKLLSMLKYSGPMILNNISWWVLNASDKLVINIFLGTAANGIFAAAGKIPGLITSVYTVFHMAWMESASREQDQEGLEDFYSGVFRSLLAVISFGVVAILLTGRILFPLLIDERYSEAFSHIPILLIGLFFLCMAQFYGGIYVGMHRSSELGWTSAAAAAVNLTVDLILIHFVGLYAASISTLTAYFAIFIIRCILTGRVVKIHYRLREILLTLACIGAALAGSYLLNLWYQLALLAFIALIYLFVYRSILTELKQMVLKKLRK